MNNNRYQVGEFQLEKYPIWDTQELRIISECENLNDANLIKTALNRYNFVADIFNSCK